MLEFFLEIKIFNLFHLKIQDKIYLGNWHTEWSNERMGLIPDPGDNFALCPNGLLIHDTQHDLLCFQPLQRSKINEGRLLVRMLSLILLRVAKLRTFGRFFWFIG